MRHDESTEEMTLGLYAMSWTYGSMCNGHLEWIHRENAKASEKEQNHWRGLTGIFRLTHKGTRNTMHLLRDVIENRGFKTLYPMDSAVRAPSILSKWVGLSGDGICPDCMKKPPKEAKYRGKFVKKFSDAVTMMWQGYVVSLAYNHHQRSALYASEFFQRDEDAYTVEVAYQTYHSQLQQGMECHANTINSFAEKNLGKDRLNRDVYRLAARFRDIPPVTDLGFERDWCPACKKRVVDVPDKILEVL